MSEKLKIKNMCVEITAAEAEEKGMSFLDVMRSYEPDITEDGANYILWNETCYPFDNAATVKQIYHYFKNLPCKPE